METRNLAGDDISKYRYWEWTQGVGLYGLWKLFTYRKDEKILNILREYYDRQLAIGFPALNVNTVTPYLAMAHLAVYTEEEKYMEPCIRAARDIMEHFPRTQEGGFQHLTSDSVNEGELWDDTLFMTVLFLAYMGRVLSDEAMVEEAEKQFLLHEKYLQDPETGLWYHGWSFLRKDNFAAAFWGRGNCWITMAIPELIGLGGCSPELKEHLTKTLQMQVDALRKCQADNGMWHTLLDDPTSYVEASATCGFAYGILKGIREGLLTAKDRELAEKALDAILECISDKGVVNQVSYGTPMGRESKDFYKAIPLQPMPYGQALASLFLMEYLVSKPEEG
ncbi:MAG: glycoside hydrolase family 88 protein [Lachnospiraceae bacterium]|nr:glycoside hydrolase family 88 protein [Lachnospiraceae bacterium]